MGGAALVRSQPACLVRDMERERVLGVYSHVKRTATGVGGTAQDYLQKTYWFVFRLTDQEFEVQPLNQNHMPSGIRSVISKRVFVENYHPEHDYYQVKTLPLLKSLQSKIEKGEYFLKEKDLDAAEQQFFKAVSLDPANPRANFGLGNIYSEQGSVRKLKKVIDVLLDNDETFRDEVRHQFNEFGMNLRKSNLFEEAVRYYKKALESSPKDENLHFNIARAYDGQGDAASRDKHLAIALELNPEFGEAVKFVQYAAKAGDAAAAPRAAERDGSVDIHEVAKLVKAFEKR